MQKTPEIHATYDPVDRQPKDKEKTQEIQTS